MRMGSFTALENESGDLPKYRIGVESHGDPHWNRLAIVLLDGLDIPIREIAGIHLKTSKTKSSNRRSAR